MKSGSGDAALVTSVYLDTSALMKLLVAERGSAELRESLQANASWLSSELTVVELLRASAQHGLGIGEAARKLLERIVLVPLTRHTLATAGRLPPVALRSLDAIHLAAALGVGARAHLVTYDRRLAAAAHAHGLTVLSPGA